MKKELLKLKENKNGITLIALVITIIVLLILAGVTISTLTGDNGLITKASEAKIATEESGLKEEIELMLLQAKMGDNLKDIFKGGRITPDPEETKTATVYEVEYKDKKFLISNDFKYIPLVEPENVEDWEYSNDGTITKYIGKSTNVIIPNYINGIRIKKLGFRIFKDKTLKKLTISNGIEEIAYLGFQYGLGSLEGDLVIPDSITSLPGGCGFTNCGANGKLRLSKNLKLIGTDVFAYCTNLKGDLIIPDSVEEIGGTAFRNCSSLDGILKIGGNVKAIGDRAFMDCSNLKGDIVLPNSLESLGWEAFRACTSINSVTFLNKDTAIGDGALNSISVIKGYTGSTAEAYATSNRKTFIPLD